MPSAFTTAVLQTFRTNCGDEAWLLCGAVEKPTDNNVVVSRHHGLTRGRGDQHEIEVPMSTMPSHMQPEFSAPSFLVKPSVEAFSIPPTELKNDQPQNGRPSFRKRTSLAFTYYVIVFFRWRRGHFGLADLWRRSETPDCDNRLYLRSAAAQRHIARSRRGASKYRRARHWHRHQYRHQSGADNE